jgi:hypothetical protein
MTRAVLIGARAIARRMVGVVLGQSSNVLGALRQSFDRYFDLTNQSNIRYRERTCGTMPSGS